MPHLGQWLSSKLCKRCSHHGVPSVAAVVQDDYLPDGHIQPDNYSNQVPTMDAPFGGQPAVVYEPRWDSWYRLMEPLFSSVSPLHPTQLPMRTLNPLTLRMVDAELVTDLSLSLISAFRSCCWLHAIPYHSNAFAFIQSMVHYVQLAPCKPGIQASMLCMLPCSRRRRTRSSNATDVA